MPQRSSIAVTRLKPAEAGLPPACAHGLTFHSPIQKSSWWKTAPARQGYRAAVARSSSAAYRGSDLRRSKSLVDSITRGGSLSFAASSRWVKAASGFPVSAAMRASRRRTWRGWKRGASARTREYRREASVQSERSNAALAESVRGVCASELAGIATVRASASDNDEIFMIDPVGGSPI